MFSMLVYHYSFFNPRHYKLLLVISGEKNDRKKYAFSFVETN